MKQNQVILHGECMVFPAKLPAGATKINVRNYLVVADSETTGNHHVIDAGSDIEFFENEGTRYMVNAVPAAIRCVHADRHDTISIPPGVYEFGTQQEYDPFTANLRNVRD